MVLGSALRERRPGAGGPCTARPVEWDWLDRAQPRNGGRDHMRRDAKLVIRRGFDRPAEDELAAFAGH